MGRPLKVHGELHGHRTKAELAKRTLPVPARSESRDSSFELVIRCESRDEAERLKAWITDNWDVFNEAR